MTKRQKYFLLALSCKSCMMLPAVRDTVIAVSRAQLSRERHTQMKKSAQGSVNHRLGSCLVTHRWINSVYKSLMDTYFRQLERFPPLFAQHQSVTFLETNTQQIYISNLWHDQLHI